MVEALPGDRFEEAAEPKLDSGDAVQRRVQGGELERALGNVGRNDVLGVAGGVHGLDSTSGPEVEYPAGRNRHDEAAEGTAGAADAEHVAFTERMPERQFAEVAHDPPAVGAELVEKAVGAQLDERTKPSERGGCRHQG